MFCLTNQIALEFNRGKDFSQDTVEIVGTAEPGSYVSLNLADYELYAKGVHTFITPNDVSITIWWRHW